MVYNKPVIFVVTGFLTALLLGALMPIFAIALTKMLFVLVKGSRNPPFPPFHID